jgi:hypothetical protein
LAVDERVAERPVLRQADERRVDNRLTVRVVVARRVAGDLGALEVFTSRAEVKVAHGDEDAALRRLEPVTDVGQRPVHDRAHRVRQVAVLQLLLDVQVLDAVGRRRGGRGRRRGRSLFGHWDFSVRFDGQKVAISTAIRGLTASGKL